MLKDQVSPICADFHYQKKIGASSISHQKSVQVESMESRVKEIRGKRQFNIVIVAFPNVGIGGERFIPPP